MKIRDRATGMRSVLWLALLAVLGAGCAAGLKPPGLQLVDLGVERLHLTGLDLEVGFRLRNPNPVPLEIERFEYDLSLNGRRIGTGYVTEAIKIPAYEQHELKSTFDMGFLSLPSAIKRIFDQDVVSARVDATFHVRHKDRLDTLTASSEGDINLTRR